MILRKSFQLTRGLYQASAGALKSPEAMAPREGWGTRTPFRQPTSYSTK